MYLFSANKIHLILIILIVWDMVWRSNALWKSARNKHLAWFICLIIFNTIGVLPIIYILIDRYKKKEEEIA